MVNKINNTVTLSYLSSMIFEMPNFGYFCILLHSLDAFILNKNVATTFLNRKTRENGGLDEVLEFTRIPS